MDFATEQKQNVLEAAKIVSNNKDKVIALTGTLLKAIADHPSLLESTYEYNEDIQNAVNELADEINFQERVSRFFEIALEQVDEQD